MIGNIHLFNVAGMLLTSLVLYRRSQAYEYRILLYFSFICGASLPVLSLALRSNQLAYQLLFILAGIFATTFKIVECKYAFDFVERDLKEIMSGLGFSDFSQQLFFHNHLSLLRAKR